MKTVRLALCITLSLMFLSPVLAQGNKYGGAKLISMPEYNLSDTDKAAGIDGELSLMVRIDKSGKVKNAEVWSGPFWPCSTKLDDSIKRVRDDVRKTMMAAKFEPAMLNGKPSEADMLMTFLVGKTYEQAGSTKDTVAGNSSTKIPYVGNLNARVKDLPRPEYPGGARGVSVVSVFVVVNEEGKVIIAGSKSGGSELAFGDAARTAACKAKFAPMLVNRYPVSISGVLTYNFGLTVR